MHPARKTVNLFIGMFIAIVNKILPFCCNIRLCGIAVVRWRVVSNTDRSTKLFFFQGRDTGREVSKWQSRECWEFILSPAQRCYACTQTGSVWKAVNPVETADNPAETMLSAVVETMQTGVRLGSRMFSRCYRHRYSIVEHCKTKNHVLF